MPRRNKSTPTFEEEKKIPVEREREKERAMGKGTLERFCRLGLSGKKTNILPEGGTDSPNTQVE